ncbi:MAG: oxidoreductase [Paenibacillus sp.]|jgi:predicted dehydrogenase|nr:oxidoreductase [Paenibacillus sp.]
MKIGIIGCGNISGVYLKNLPAFPNLKVAACADLDLERAVKKADQFGVPKACSVQELLADPEVGIVLNLTIPKAHAEVSLAALGAGKHVYAEKPLAVTPEDGARVLELANRKGLRVGCAPDTFLGAGIQTCRKLIDDGAIGTPVAATAFMMGAGPERWHPDPAFYFEEGAGPLFDMGPYYLSAYIHLLGPIRRVTGSAAVSFPERIVTSAPKYGTVIRVRTPTHIAGVLDFRSGAVGTLITSFDIKGGSDLPRIEIYGSEGTLRVPDPNRFGGPVLLRKPGADEWEEMPLTHDHADNGRGLGLADMVDAISGGTMHRASGELGYHVLEAMHGILEASSTGAHHEMRSDCPNVKPLPASKSPWK